MFSIWPTCEQCGLAYELSEYELNQTLAIPRLVFCSDCHHTFVLDAEEVQSIREIVNQTMSSTDPWDEDPEAASPALWKPGKPEELEAAQLEQLAHQGNTMAMLVLGALYCQGGFGLKRDFDQARYWWELAHECGENDALECLEQLESEMAPRSLPEPDINLPPHWFALREIHTNHDFPAEFSPAALDMIKRLDQALYGEPTIDGQRPEIEHETIQKQDTIIYESLRQALPEHCRPLYQALLTAQFDLEYALLIQDFHMANEYGDLKMQHQERLADFIAAHDLDIIVQVEDIQRSLDLLNIDFLS